MEVYINNTKYTIEIVVGTHPVLIGHEAIAICNTTMKKIYINQDIPNKFDILRHELTHAVIYEFIGVDVKWDSEKVCEFVQRYANMITTLASEVLL